jgi:hypothetical protein
MICFLICPMVVVLLYAIAQTRLILRLIRLLRQPGRIAQFGLAASCVVTLCILPGLMLLLLTALLVARGRYMDDSGNPLALMTFTRYGAAFALCSWVVMTIWFRRIVRRDLAIYREPVALVPVVIMSLICLNYVAIVVWGAVSSILAAGSLTSLGQLPLEVCVPVAIMIYIPAAPLAGFVLLIVHVVRVRAARTWETYIPDEQEEIP